MKILLSFCFAVFVPAYTLLAQNTIITRLQNVPVLCYHQIKDWQKDDSKSARIYITPPLVFAQEMKALHDNGYYTILPDELIAYATGQKPLRGKPIIITFDDGTESQYTNALPLLNKYNFKGVFFIMTVTINKPHYISTKQLKQLVYDGNIIGCHTWDHHDVRHYQTKDWGIQLIKSTEQLTQITGTPIYYFAYPFGTWDAVAIAQLKQQHYRAAFQLAGKYDTNSPLYTIRRILVDGHWNAQQFIHRIQQ